MSLGSSTPLGAPDASALPSVAVRLRWGTFDAYALAGHRGRLQSSFNAFDSSFGTILASSWRPDASVVSAGPVCPSLLR